VAELEMVRVDVFAEELFTGNPADVVLEADSLDEMQMQRIASEAGLAVTAFAMRSRRADLRLRFFSPHSEEPFSDHASMAAIWVLAESGSLGAVPAGRRRLETPVGILPFTVESDSGQLKRIWMTQKRPMFAEEGDVKDIASALGVGVDSLFDEEFPVGKASTGVPYLLVPLRSIDIMGHLQPKREALAELCRELDVAGVAAYSWGVLKEGSAVHLRCFAPASHSLEEPATGMAAGALVAYLVDRDFVSRGAHEAIVVEQGHWTGRPSRVLVRIERKGEGIRKVEVGGTARISFRTRIAVP
jgi:PhzF family phenazine biosynthesis protein